MRKTYTVAVLGCRVNQYEIQALSTQLESLGFSPAQDGEPVDLCIINTCAVTEHAESSSRHIIRTLIAQNPQAQVFVTGCFATKHPNVIQQIPGITAIVSNAQKETFLQERFPDTKVSSFGIKRFDGHTRAFVKIQDGCNCFCSYCIVPHLRGRSISRSSHDIVHEVSTLIHAGFKEIVLTGVNLGDFGHKECSLEDLIRQIDTIPGLQRLRLSSINPNDMTDGLIDVLVHGKTTCHNLHLVAQSGSDTILARMGRKYTRKDFCDVVEKCRRVDPDFIFSTDVIIGFPGETRDDFAATIDLLEAVQCAKVHLFPYSAREGTSAAKFHDTVDQKEIFSRKRHALQVAEMMMHTVYQQYHGQVAEVLVENTGEGLTRNGLPVVIAGALPNELVQVKLAYHQGSLQGSIL